MNRPRSSVVTEGPNRAPHRAFFKSMGLTDEDIHKPWVGVASTWNEATPCNLTLDRQALFKQGHRPRLIPPRGRDPGHVAGRVGDPPPFTQRPPAGEALLVKIEVEAGVTVGQLGHVGPRSRRQQG